MTLTFYTNPMSRGRIARWMLEEIGEPYDTMLVDWTQKPAALLDANPLGKVPTIVHDGAVVSEAAAICAYLAEAFPAAALAPRAEERAPYLRWMFFTAGPLEAAMIDKVLGVEVPEAKRGMVGYGGFGQAVDTLEYAVSAHSYITGDRFTAADVYVGSAVGWFTQFGLLEKRETFMRYLDRLQQRPAYQRAAAIDDALIAEAAQR
ncbi:glutathione S-transferase family protein [Sphingomonas endophytica]|uniref:Glutathione S-transferase n=1 Tax=Sphingomonas endophytica TaxID=869719 RepID=A0ABR6N550_9SPHN|nr:glutathione S-transferase N-terminal domain-containing protein [Sphingomonas endophytica]MBB5725924.1 glutathione S-transferase [Sphingomonas endophytica]